MECPVLYLHRHLEASWSHSYQRQPNIHSEMQHTVLQQGIAGKMGLYENIVLLVPYSIQSLCHTLFHLRHCAYQQQGDDHGTICIPKVLQLVDRLCVRVFM